MDLSVNCPKLSVGLCIIEFHIKSRYMPFYLIILIATMVVIVLSWSTITWALATIVGVTVYLLSRIVWVVGIVIFLFTIAKLLI